jgi:cytochrome oxidase Cu insertion factor (SCO1/SenC/PrrC family)
MMKRALLVVLLASMVTACGAAIQTATTNTGATTTGASAVQAPDFTLTLSDGTDFTLSSETRPVYLVFWAEW